MTAAEIAEIRNRIINSHAADFYDVMDPMGYPNQCLDLRIRPLRDDMKAIGPAFTVLGTREPLPNDEFDREAFRDWGVFDHFYPGCVVVLNAEKEDVTGHWGEMMSYGARNCGVNGAVIDGGTRDKAGILKIQDWACFARYTSPIESNRRWRMRELQQPIYMSGTCTRMVRVNPGDWIFGDCDGVIVIPQAILMEVVEKVEDLSHREELSRVALDKGEHIRNVVAKYGRA